MSRLVRKAGWKSEFPDFEMNVKIPAGFIDQSWKNDSCPSFFNEELGLKLWVDYEDVDQRDSQVNSRFSLTDENGDEVISSDDYSDILRYLNNLK